MGVGDGVGDTGIAGVGVGMKGDPCTLNPQANRRRDTKNPCIRRGVSEAVDLLSLGTMIVIGVTPTSSHGRLSL